MDNIIAGQAIAEHLKNQLATEVSEFYEHHKIRPGLAIIRIGENPASEIYVQHKLKCAKQVGIKAQEFHFEKTTPQEIHSLISKLNRDSTIHGIIVQLPLPDSLPQLDILNAISPKKDVDGLHSLNQGLLAQGNTDGLIPCTPMGCYLLLKACHEDLTGKNVVIVGRSTLVGRPLGALLLTKNATVTITHSKSKDLSSLCSKADILISAVGRPNFIKKDWIKPGATVIDVGIIRVPTSATKTTLTGDVDFDSVKGVAQHITPVPGGVGPMTVVCLLKNTLKAAQISLSKDVHYPVDLP
ncbi:MAG: bifunctional methylenetetrahydrofolate dehydrogenase/methenyltetrahydrofolate cyclohydrolase FolD [Alphaproteobacteria bacterium]|jgi:methylenetetrahydrofolate dehydrogenase (NADP+) / methenyltetrahydrofolate cyclohydrolase|nr:bifunctional methylenetetrahydrofolate dehydrogenase/methenyltetrahydrofolate cyclohydrolase FolD [Alphaproteobacteria bacterium]MBT5390500.1 bifunctional methylenetetrahydrofolate dehydrogenase/methenyltetrahydrofolate cyclohydrolase FolD [Alphaproteobacteria bacterium]MBT5540604.1 bifunctional methylenetetrahydrofolate dehydrogenase/methenyltetrahydrofolate cyclohydrolase FolD [Alphaproteobacteria bacterium]MBT5654840.1 bifunctional methylenetetrahydrofolate dehydrogenase/methenyltetrahydro